ncbi:hypothetical protein PQX77_007592 [Marasmius sp. AFHP31]|nr:hypothetical protein PQX77_007592 [Marasmius sp. AFHP31]
MSEQKALAILAPSSSYTVTSKPIPIRGTDEVLIKVQGVGLNPAERKFALYPQILDLLGYPVYTGSDGAGVVEEVGPGVNELKKGDRVLFQGWFSADYTTFQQYALAQAKMVAKLPETTSTLEAASLPMAVAMAAFGFRLPDSAVLSRSKAAQDYDLPLLTDGRAGAGRIEFSIQIAAHYNFSPIITTSSAKHAEYLRSLGSTHVVDRDTPVNKVEDLAQGKAIEYSFAAVDASTQGYVDLLAPGGTLLSAVPVSAEITFKEGRKSVLANGAGHLSKEYTYGLMGALGGFLESSVIKPNRVEKLAGGLAGLPGGLVRLQNNQVNGVKLVADPSETP